MLIFYVQVVLHDLCMPSGNKRKQIDQVVQYLEERLRELDEEKEELKKYQQLDKQRRSLEYTIFDKELHDARQKLVEVSCFKKEIKCNLDYFFTFQFLTI